MLRLTTIENGSIYVELFLFSGRILAHRGLCGEDPRDEDPVRRDSREGEDPRDEDLISSLSSQPLFCGRITVSSSTLPQVRVR